MFTDTLTDKRVCGLKNWFEQYVNKYFISFPEFEKYFFYKKIHTDHVGRIIVDISQSLYLNETERMLAELIAFLHDIGRFEQFARYQTFSDANSVNHGQLGVDVIKSHHLLSDLDTNSRNIVLKSVLYHNRFSLPDDEDDRVLFYSKLVRDADKLDIYRLFVDYYHNKCYNDNTIVHGLNDDGRVSTKICYELLNKKMPNKMAVRTLNDFKLLQISWIFDLNYQRTFQLLCEKDYLRQLFDTLPQTELVKKVFAFSQQYILNHC